MPLFDYSLNAARRWKLAKGVGDKGGILLMLAIRDRKWRVQLTDSLRVDLPEEVLKIHGERMSAPFRQGDTGAGVNLFVDALIANLAERRASTHSAHRSRSHLFNDCCFSCRG
ncbi:MAG TPA: TPM domain-containing protein [Pyrinomonadaceae bacterium]